MTDIFQFYSGSADAKPGKGTGETLVSAPSIYSALQAIKDWRKTLSSESETSAEVLKILPLTQSAQLWYAPLRKPKVRRVDLETKRQELLAVPLSAQEEGSAQSSGGPPPQVEEAQSNPTPAVEEMADVAPKKSRAPKKPAKEEEAPAAAPAPAAKPTKSKSKKAAPSASGGAGAVPENVLALSSAAAAGGAFAPLNSGGSAPQEADYSLAPPNLEESEDTSAAIRFCPICRYYLYLKVEDETQDLIRHCRNCGFQEKDTKGGLISEILVQERSAEGYKILLNEHTRRDPRLPHIRGTLKCPSSECPSNTSGKESDIIYMKYDPVNLLYIYVCNVEGCGFEWRSGQ